MAGDKYTAVWVSHTSISDFLKCPKAYFLKNVYKDPKTGNKIKLMSPPLALGQVVHEVLESLSVLPVDSRFKNPLMVKFTEAWEKVKGKKGGFFDSTTELKYQNQGKEMLRRVQNNPGPLKKLAVKIQKDLPYFWLSEEENIILCGKIDWLEYMEETDSVHIIDFKTGSNKEDEKSLQLPIYHLLVKNCQKRDVEKASYWYLRYSDKLTEKKLPNIKKAKKKVLEVAKKIKLARQLERFECPKGERGCFVCKPMQKIIKGDAEHVGVDNYGADVYVLPNPKEEKKSVIL